MLLCFVVPLLVDHAVGALHHFQQQQQLTQARYASTQCACILWVSSDDDDKEKGEDDLAQGVGTSMGASEDAAASTCTALPDGAPGAHLDDQQVLDKGDGGVADAESMWQWVRLVDVCLAKPRLDVPGTFTAHMDMLCEVVSTVLSLQMAEVQEASRSASLATWLF